MTKSHLKQPFISSNSHSLPFNVRLAVLIQAYYRLCLCLLGAVDVSTRKAVCLQQASLGSIWLFQT